jgi:cob(I)alamin adenosyltransferase
VAKLYTGKGDGGRTVLFDGTPVRKDDKRVSAYGAIDELNAHLGVAIGLLQPRTEAAWKTLHDRLVQVQGLLFALGAELASPSSGAARHTTPPVTVERVSHLEAWIDEAAAPVPALTTFVLPGGEAVAAQLHVCRTVCRRAERQVVTLAQEASINPQAIVTLNRLSDLLFAWARLANHLAGVSEVPWHPRKE